ncbi:MAG: Helicase associated domain protein [Lachnospiraceae bacterium]|nr:Helicase associated domain protein [Lachnospiraceae bacterium]
MSILFEHNQKAYEAAVSMLEETGKAAVIHPTGTGKSFIAFQLCADDTGCKVCWLSPSEYIFTTQLEKWSEAGGKELKNIEFVTYARLMRMPGDALEKIRPDYIILDEFHRCGAAQWGGGVERLREMYPEAKVLGLSATNIRYLDNQRDMAWELFGGNVASELTLGAAVATGILPAPKYVLSVYSYQKELQRYEMRVQQARNRAVRDKAERELEALRRALEKADGLEDVFARHMVAGDREEREAEPGMAGNREERKAAWQEASFGRYIVFCASYEHLLEMRELATEWFAKVDSAPHIYTAYSDDPATSAEFGAFKADTSGHLKLLYCIDMLNEGIHVDGVDGVILLRPTVSPTIYKQQIGRALAAGGKKTPVIFDIVMNIENLYSIGAVEEELRGAVFACRAGGRGDAIVNEHFRVIDELGDCRRLFAQLNETLGASWDAMYEMAKGYYAEHGNLDVPVKYTTADGYSLGAWVLTQRKVYRGKTAGCLSREQVKRLSAIGMCWQGAQETAWERNFAKAEKYFQEHGNLDVPADYVTGDGCRLGRWLRRQREVYQKLAEPGKCKGDVASLDAGAVDEAGNSGMVQRGKHQSVHMERMQRLVQIGMGFENTDPWEQKFELAKQYYEEHGNMRMAADYIVGGVWLDRWLREQKARMEADSGENNAASDGKSHSLLTVEQQREEQGGGTRKRQRSPLTKEQKDKLLSIGIKPGVSQAELSWREQYGEAVEFYRRHGNLSIPKRYAARNGKNLGVWLQHQRTNRRNGQLAGWQVCLLDGIGMVWESPDAWEVGFAHAEEYARQAGNLEVPNAYVCADGYRLGKWISNQRCAYGGVAKKGLGEERVHRLEKIGMVWNAGQGRRTGVCRTGKRK